MVSVGWELQQWRERESSECAEGDSTEFYEDRSTLSCSSQASSLQCVNSADCIKVKNRADATAISVMEA